MKFVHESGANEDQRVFNTALMPLPPLRGFRQAANAGLSAQQTSVDPEFAKAGERTSPNGGCLPVPFQSAHKVLGSGLHRSA